ncbi:MAG: helix-turn-helix domain-containing protein [Alphaproteobacteria bacterium]|nr:helix-turn-helix domain-containing protein [Alphaproteobacteria bacterium]
MRWNELESEPCPVARAVSVIGDRWTVLVLRESFKGATRFEEFCAGLGAPRATVASRLAGLVEAGVLLRRPYADHPPRSDYLLTDRGRALQPVIMTLAHWSETWLAHPTAQAFDRRHTICGHRFKPVVSCSKCGEEIQPGEVEYGTRQKTAKTASLMPGSPDGDHP